MQEPENLRKAFADLYGTHGNEPVLFFAPGRVNLIGEHTDYNGGFVFPCAIQYGTYLLIRKTDDNLIKLASVNDPQKTVIPVTDHFSKQSFRWFNYPLGIFEQFIEKGFPVGGMELLFYGDISANAGLSSSASIEMVTAYALNHILSGGLAILDLVKMSQKAEHEFAGVNCGIMDQFASAAGLEGNALLIDCRVNQAMATPIPEALSLVVCDTATPRHLGTAYNTRRSECELGVRLIAEREPGVESLRDVDVEMLERNRDRLPENVAHRCEHIVREDDRVMATVTALKNGDLDALGRLFAASHASLRDLLEVSSPELDIMVEIATAVPGVIASRMTGGGFGGCTVSLVARGAEVALQETVLREYKKRTGLAAKVYAVSAVDGAGEIEAP
jgi:galactokinase